MSEVKFPLEMTCHLPNVFVISHKSRFLGHTVAQAKFSLRTNSHATQRL